MLLRSIAVRILSSFLGVTGLPLSAYAELNFNAISDQDVRQAKCVYRQGSNEQYRKVFLNNMIKNENKSELGNYEVHGIKFIDENPELVHRFMQLTSRHGEQGQIEQEKLDYSKIVNPSCHKVLCALNQLFGESRAQKVLFLLLSYNVNASHLAFKDADAFFDQELDAILKTFDLIPSFLTQINDDQKAIHFRRAHIPSDNQKNIMANAGIVFFNLWNEQTPETMIYAVFHEIAHNWSITVNGRWDFSSEWLNASGWRAVGNDYLNPRWNNIFPNSFVSQYAKVNVREDFAETASAYRFSPEKLKNFSAQKYEFMKNYIFGGLEFNQDSDCSDSPPHLNSFQRVVNSKFQDKNIDDRILKNSVVLCNKYYVDSLLDPGVLYFYQNCVKNYIAFAISQSVIKKASSLLPRFAYNAITSRPDVPDKSNLINRAYAESTAYFKELCKIKGLNKIESKLQQNLQQVGISDLVSLTEVRQTDLATRSFCQ